MFNQDNWEEIFNTIKKNKLRTFLSGFTVALGIFIFVILFGFGNGLKNTFNTFFIDDQPNSMFIFPGKTSLPYKGYESNLEIVFNNSDLDKVNKKFKDYIESITPRIESNGIIKYKTKSSNYSFRAVNPAHQKSEMTIITEGRYINWQDVAEKKKHLVIGRLVKKDLFGNKNPIGQYVSQSGTTWKVVGVFEDAGGDREERTVYSPYSTLQLLQNNNEIDMMIINYHSDINYNIAIKLKDEIYRFLKEQKNIHPEDNSAIYIRNTSSDLEEKKTFASVLQVIIWFIGIGTLIAGIIGISNIMVFIVKERTKEIGIRKAIGATPRSIILMVLRESVFITILSGYIGLFLGIITLKLIGNKLETLYFITNPYIDLKTGLTATIMLIFFGAIAGYIPARKAANIKPIIAIRDE